MIMKDCETVRRGRGSVKGQLSKQFKVFNAILFLLALQTFNKASETLHQQQLLAMKAACIGALYCLNILHIVHTHTEIFI